MNSNTLQSMYKKPLWWIGAMVALSMVLASCAPAATPVPTVPPAPTATLAPAAPATTAMAEASISIATDPKYGKILVDGKGMTLYMFTKDEPNKSNCSGGCLKAWPPLATQGTPKLGDGVDATLIGNTALADGSKVVTYNKMPLYYWAKDTKPGDITGLGVGGVWYLVSADGTVVGK